MKDLIEAQSERPWAELEKLSVKDLIDRHDRLAFTSGLGTEYYREEIRYRRQRSLTRVMLGLTVVIVILTGVVTWATVQNMGRDDPPPVQATPR